MLCARHSTERPNVLCPACAAAALLILHESPHGMTACESISAPWCISTRLIADLVPLCMLQLAGESRWSEGAGLTLRRACETAICNVPISCDCAFCTIKPCVHMLSYPRIVTKRASETHDRSVCNQPGSNFVLGTLCTAVQRPLHHTWSRRQPAAAEDSRACRLRQSMRPFSVLATTLSLVTT